MIRIENKELVDSLRLHSKISGTKDYTVLYMDSGIPYMTTQSSRIVYKQRIIHPEGEVMEYSSSDTGSYYFPGSILKEAVREIKKHPGWGALYRNSTTTQLETNDKVFTFQYEGDAKDLRIPNISSCMPTSDDLICSFYMSPYLVHEALSLIKPSKLVSLKVDVDTRTYQIEELVSLTNIDGKQSYGNYHSFPMPQSADIFDKAPLVIYRDFVMQFDIHVGTFLKLLKMFNAKRYSHDTYVHCVLGTIFSSDYDISCAQVLGLRNCVDPLDTEGVTEEGWILTNDFPCYNMKFKLIGTSVKPKIK